MSEAVRIHLEESERQLALAQMRRDIGDYSGAVVAEVAAQRAADRARREGRRS